MAAEHTPILAEYRKKKLELASDNSTFEFGGGGGDNGDMKTDIALLKHRADVADQRMARVEEKLDTLIDRVSSLPTMNGMWGMVATVLGISVASLGTVIAILTWLQGFHH